MELKVIKKLLIKENEDKLKQKKMNKLKRKT